MVHKTGKRKRGYSKGKLKRIIRSVLHALFYQSEAFMLKDHQEIPALHPNGDSRKTIRAREKRPSRGRRHISIKRSGSSRRTVMSLHRTSITRNDLISLAGHMYFERLILPLEYGVRIK